MSDNDCQGEGPEFVERAGRDKLKEKIAWALRKRNQQPPYNAATQWHDLAEAVLTAIEDAGFVIVPSGLSLTKRRILEAMLQAQIEEKGTDNG
jgi:hypothetical protein